MFKLRLPTVSTASSDHATRSGKLRRSALGLVPFALLAATSFSTACGESGDTLSEVRTLKKNVCACKDAACVAKLKKESAGLDSRVAQLTGEDMDKAIAIAVDMMKCASELGVPQDAL